MSPAEITERVQHLRDRMASHGVPDRIAAIFARYLERGTPPGSWAEAVLHNDLTNAIMLGDTEARAAVPGVVLALYDSAPVWAWGHPDRVRSWRGIGGLRGMHNASQGPQRPPQAPGMG